MSRYGVILCCHLILFCLIVYFVLLVLGHINLETCMISIVTGVKYVFGLEYGESVKYSMMTYMCGDFLKTCCSSSMVIRSTVYSFHILLILIMFVCSVELVPLLTIKICASPI